MLTQGFIASVLGTTKEPGNSIARDTGIFVYDLQPLTALRSNVKKSSTNPNSITVSGTHVFAAQADKAIVHVYGRDRLNQETLIPFPEHISCLVYSGGHNSGGFLVLGTAGGRVIVWEPCTGRQVSTPPSHLQSVTCLAVDPTSNFVLSGSLDSHIHVWLLPSILSFSQSASDDPDQPTRNAPFKTLSSHRAAITQIVVGHGIGRASIAVSASQDSSCIVWDYQSGSLLHTFLLPSAPLCLAIDPADRAFYAGYEDGSVQLVDLYKTKSLAHPIYDQAQRLVPTQPSSADRWGLPSESTASTLCLAVTYDGTAVLSGHRNGKVEQWDVAKGRYGANVADLSSPVTNLLVLQPTGFSHSVVPTLRLQKVLKPHYEGLFNSNADTMAGSSGVPAHHIVSAQFSSSLPLSTIPDLQHLDFNSAQAHTSFPSSLLEEGVAILAACSTSKSYSKRNRSSSDGLTDSSGEDGPVRTQSDIANLRAALSHARTIQAATTERMLGLQHEMMRFKALERQKATAKKQRRLRKLKAEEIKRRNVVEDDASGVHHELQDHSEFEKEDLSSDTNELTQSD